MHRSIPNLMTLLVAAGFTLPAAAHNHITIDTQSGQPNDYILLDVGYYPGDSAFSLDQDRQLLKDGQIFTYELTEPAAHSTFQGWHTAATDMLTLTSDFYYASGRLDGGDFQYQIVDVQPVNGSAAAEYAHAIDHHGQLQNIARSDGDDQLEKSFHVGMGAHDHGQSMFISDPGIYDITLQAWDANERYLSEPGYSDMTFRIVPEPATAGFLAAGGLALLMRRSPHRV